MGLIDTHCHLDQPQFAADRAGVIERAQAAGIDLIVNPAVDLASCRAVLDLAGRHEGIYAAVGVHPNDCEGFDEGALRALRELARNHKVVALGEIGLDYYWERVAHDQQKRALRMQLDLAAELGLPVILHSRESNADLLDELSRWAMAAPREGIRGVWHAFSGDLDQARRAYELGFVVSLGGPVTFKNARQLQALVPQLDPDRLMLETDAPYLAPHPHRGQRNEPAYLPLIAESLAGLLGVEVETLSAQTGATARRCFARLK